MTNADRIRKMTNEELCKFIIMVECNDLQYETFPCEYCEKETENDCNKCLKLWLKRDAKKERGLNEIFTNAI